MKALVYTGPHSMEYREEPEPQGDAQLSVVATHAVGICGSDMHAYLGHDARRPAPLILGHEAAGIVLSGPRAGKRVSANPLIGCGKCPACKSGQEHICPDRLLLSIKPRQGAFADQFAVPDANLVEVPDHVPMEHAALNEPLAVCWHAAKLSERILAKPLSEARCLVVGGGAIGMGCALTLQVFGAGQVAISEPNSLRHPTLKAAGEFEVQSTEDTAKQAGHYDLVIDAVGYGATRAASSEAVTPGGAIIHVGLGDSEPGLDVRRLTLQEIAFAGSYCYTQKDFQETADAIFAGKYGDFGWIEERALKDGRQAFEDIHAGRVAATKIILRP